MKLLQFAVEIVDVVSNFAIMTLKVVSSFSNFVKSQFAIMTFEVVSNFEQIKIFRRFRDFLQITNKTLRQQQTKMTQTAMIETWDIFLIYAFCFESFECSITFDCLIFDYLIDNCQIHVYALLLLFCLFDFKMFEQVSNIIQSFEQTLNIIQLFDRRNNCYIFDSNKIVHNRIELEITTWLRSFEHDNKIKLNFQIFFIICYYLRNSKIKVFDQTKLNLKSRVKRNFVLRRNILHYREFEYHKRQKITKFEFKRVVEIQWIYQFVMNKHKHLNHDDRNRIWSIIRNKYYDISQTKINHIFSICKICQKNNFVIVKDFLRQITINFVMKRYQMNLMNYRNQSNEIYKWILHVKVNCSFIVLIDDIEVFC